MGAIDDDLQLVQAQVAREARLGSFDVAAGGVVEALARPSCGGRGEACAHVARHQRLDLASRCRR